MNMVLVPIHGGTAITLDKAIVFFGRGSECDIVLTDSRKVSRKHCCVAQIDDRIVIRDLGSMNGVRINENPVRTECELSVGDVLWVGDLGFRLEPMSANNLKTAASRRKPSSPKKKPTPTPDPRYLSQDFPVAIPEEDEKSQPENPGGKGMIPEDEIIDLDDADDLDDSDFSDVV